MLEHRIRRVRDKPARIVLPLVGLTMLAACNHEPKVTEIDATSAESGRIKILTQPRDSVDDNDAEIEGPLILVDGCLRIGDPRNPRRASVVVWPKGYGVAVDDEEILILDTDGQRVARVGDEVIIGGSEGWLRRDSIGGCSAPFWSMLNNDRFEVIATATN